MTDKELRRMNRRELLEMLIDQIEKNEKQQEELERLNTALHDKQIAIEDSGSIAEAALRVNDIFTAAENAAQQYLDNLRQGAGVRKVYEEAHAKAEAIIAEAEAYSREAHEKADAHTRKSQAEADTSGREGS